MSWLFTLHDQNTGASTSASVLPMSIQGLFPLRLTGLISLLSSGVFFSTTVKGISSLAFCLLYGPALTKKHDHWEDIWIFVGRVMSLIFNTLSRFVIAFLQRSTCLLISLVQSPSTVILEPKKRKSVTISHFSPSLCHEVMGLDATILVFLIFSFKLALSCYSFTLIKSLSSSSSLSAIRVVSNAYLRLLAFLLPILIPACNSPGLAFLIMCSAYRLNKQGDRRQPCHTPFSILNQSVVP